MRRADLNLSNVKPKKICSVHFEVKAYNCPTDIANSTLIPNALPTLVTCPNPPKLEYSCSRPAPKDRSSVSPHRPCKRRKKLFDDASTPKDQEQPLPSPDLHQVEQKSAEENEISIIVEPADPEIQELRKKLVATEIQLQKALRDVANLKKRVKRKEEKVAEQSKKLKEMQKKIIMTIFIQG